MCKPRSYRAWRIKDGEPTPCGKLSIDDVLDPEPPALTMEDLCRWHMAIPIEDEINFCISVLGRMSWWSFYSQWRWRRRKREAERELQALGMS